MSVDLTPATSLSTMAGYGLATSHGILNSTAHLMPAVIDGGRGSERRVEVQRTADQAVTTVDSPLGELGRTAHVLRAARAIW